MVIQLSFLAWSHEHQSLSQALTQAIDDMLVESRTATSHGLNYVSLLGTVGACQRQTTGFSWAHHYAAIEDKIFKELTNSSSRERPEKRRKSRSGQAITHVHQQSVSDRTLPYVILRGLVKSLDSIQRFPEDCILQLPCDRRISSAVLCCYHVLGISVLIRLIMRSLEVSAILLQRASENFPVFTLNRDDADPYIRCDQRKAARGFLREILTSHGVKTDELVNYGTALVSQCYKHFDLNSSIASGNTIENLSLSRSSQHASESNESDTIQVASSNQSSQYSDQSHKRDESVDCTSINHSLRLKILQAASFLLDLDADDLCDNTVELVKTSRKRNIFWPAITDIIYAFARVGDLTGCELLPLSIDTFEELTTENQSNIDIDGFRWPIPDTLDCFEITCRLLLGSRFTKDYVAKAFLISSHGWSVFLDIMEASDPTDVASGTLHIKPGVPARDGIRKTQIIDGMTDFGIDAARELLFNSEPRTSFWPGLRLGSYRTRRSEVDRRREIDKYLTWPAAAKFEDNTKLTYVVKHPEDEWNASRIPERIFRCRGPWYFYVTGDGAARWLDLDNLDQLSLEGNDYPIVAVSNARSV
ncbi:hypothetical protein SUNI508_07297 [Seiridium unicorne]|uniref:Uncharacterized protein n=1 Tax=Seiridium unicorne TaxID=138068 RepID=A0ABR2UZ54_9PEZI